MSNLTNAHVINAILEEVKDILTKDKDANLFSIAIAIGKSISLIENAQKFAEKIKVEELRREITADPPVNSFTDFTNRPNPPMPEL